MVFRQGFPYKSWLYAEVALMVEHLTCNQGVAGSTPVLGSQSNTIIEVGGDGTYLRTEV